MMFGKALEDMVARDGVEPPMPAFSGGTACWNRQLRRIQIINVRVRGLGRMSESGVSQFASQKIDFSPEQMAKPDR